MQARLHREAQHGGIGDGRWAHRTPLDDHLERCRKRIIGIAGEDRVGGDGAQMNACEGRVAGTDARDDRRPGILSLIFAQLPLAGQHPERIMDSRADAAGHVGIAALGNKLCPAGDRGGGRDRRRIAAAARTRIDRGTGIDRRMHRWDRMNRRRRMHRRVDRHRQRRQTGLSEARPGGKGRRCSGRFARHGRSPQSQRVRGAKSVETASSSALKAKKSPGRYCAISASASASMARSLARSSVSRRTR